MAKTIITDRQRHLLKLLFEEPDILKNFYLSGGTALAEFYLLHRYSEDLDFFTFEEVNPLGIHIILKKISPKMNIKKIDFQQSFNRNLFFLHFTNEVIKTEFTYYPFTQIQTPKIINNIKVDSLIDIAVNKTFTIYQNPRTRDFIDLYFIIKKEKWDFSDLMKKARIKFDSPIDFLQMAQQLIKIASLKDYPKLISHIDDKKLQDFWIKEIHKLKRNVLI